MESIGRGSGEVLIIARDSAISHIHFLFLHNKIF